MPSPFAADVGTLAIDLFFALLIGASSYRFVLYGRQLKKLRGANARIRAVVDHVFDGIVTISQGGTIIAMNPAAQRMFGCEGIEQSGKPFIALVPKRLESGAHGSPVAGDWTQLTQHAGGTVFALAQTRAKVSFNVELSLTESIVDRERFYVAVIRDITERKRFEEALAAEKNSLAVTLASIGDGVITTDLAGRIVISNKAAEAMTGWPTKDAIGKPLRAVFAVSDAASEHRKRNGTTGYRTEAEAILLSTPERAVLTSRDGVERITEQVASPILDAKNDVRGVVLVFRDITERQRDEAERRKAEALEQLGLLAGGIAHDFNNLLTAIIGNISLISSRVALDNPMSARLDDAKNASLRARDLAQQLLTFARGGAPIKQTASITNLVEDTVGFSLRGSQVRSELKIAPDLWAAEFDPGQISQVIANLIVNADQAMPNGGKIQVRCENFSFRPGSELPTLDLPAGDYIRIAVRDEGTGIPESCLKRIFDPYFTTKAKGSGLGLATSYSIMKNHNGMITVDSQLHCGSTFTIYLPAEHDKRIVVEPEKPLSEPLNGSGRVLVVDDEEAIRMLIQFTLSDVGYEVTQAGTAQRGIELYRQQLESGRRFDLVILDLTLPGGMGGREVLKKLIDMDPMVNALVSSGYATDATMSRYEDFGFRGRIAKPYEPAELARKVQEMIEADRQQPTPCYELQRA